MIATQFFRRMLATNNLTPCRYLRFHRCRPHDPNDFLTSEIANPRGQGAKHACLLVGIDNSGQVDPAGIDGIFEDGCDPEGDGLSSGKSCFISA